MLKAALAIARKDLILLAGRGAGLVQSLLLGLLLIFLFSLARGVGEVFSPLAAAAIFWMATLFCQVLVFTSLYSLEEQNGQRQGLLLAPAPAQSIWLGKAAAGMLMLLIAQAVFLAAVAVFLDQSPQGALLSGLAGIVLADLGIAAVGSLLGALSQGQAAKESLLCVIIFPLLLPLLLAALRITAAAVSPEYGQNMEAWFGTLLGFDAIFLAAGLVLFGHVYSGGD